MRFSDECLWTRKVGLQRVRLMIGAILIGFASRSVGSVVLPSALSQPSASKGGVA
jgi:hypothetical protein